MGRVVSVGRRNLRIGTALRAIGLLIERELSTAELGELLGLERRTAQRLMRELRLSIPVRVRADDERGDRFYYRIERGTLLGVITKEQRDEA